MKADCDKNGHPIFVVSAWCHPRAKTATPSRPNRKTQRSANPSKQVAKSANPFEFSSKLYLKARTLCAPSPKERTLSNSWLRSSQKCEPFANLRQKCEPFAWACNPYLPVALLAAVVLTDVSSTGEGVVLVAELFCNTPSKFTILRLQSFHLAREVNFRK